MTENKERERERELFIDPNTKLKINFENSLDAI